MRQQGDFNLGGTACERLQCGVNEAGHIAIMLIRDKPEAFVILNPQQLQEFIKDLTEILGIAKKQVN